MSEPTKVQQAIAVVRTGIANCSSTEELQKMLENALDVVKSEKTVKYGCHCDLEPGQKPDACVMDTGDVHGCIYAAGLIDKWECKWWKPVI